MKFKVKTVKRDELEKTLNNYEPYTLTPFAVVPDIYVDQFDRTITDYKIIYRVVPEEDLQESAE